MAFIKEPARETPIAMKADVVVVGGGPAGVGAAICAARNGADTIVIEKFGSLGGTNNTGLMSVCMGNEIIVGVAREIIDRLQPEYAVDVVKKYPDINANPLTHYFVDQIDGLSANELVAWDPDVAAYVMSDMLEKLGVRFALCSLFVDTIVEDGAIKAVIVENASGRQAIEGKVFIDATGRGEVVARSGSPYASAANEQKRPMPPGIMWKMTGVNLERLFEYQKTDPRLAVL
jgi:flavin-dependent dehydrogenase